MKLTTIYALFAAIIFALCITQQAAAGEKGKATGHSGEYAKADGFRDVRLADSLGGLNALRVPSAGKGLSGADAAGRARLEGVGPDMFKVLSVIARRTGDRELLEKVKYKLSTMTDNRLRLAVSLSERASDGEGVRTDIAFFLLSTVIIFS